MDYNNNIGGYPNPNNNPYYNQFYGQQPVRPIIQNFIQIQNEKQMLDYQTAPGTTTNFISASEPYIYTKTVPTSPFQKTVYERYRLVKDNGYSGNAPAEAQEEKPVEHRDYITREELEALLAERTISRDALEQRLEELTVTVTPKTVRREKHAESNP